MLQTSSEKTTLQGLDVFHLDSILSWTDIARGNSFAFLKASQGLSSSDSSFASYWTEAQKAGLIVGAYHFMGWGGGTGAAQAKHFKNCIDNAGGLSKDNLPPVIDWEYSPERDPIPADVQIGKDFLEEIAQLTGRKPIVYLSSSLPGELGAPSWLANYYLWIASYRSSPLVPQPWTDWTFWQNSDSAKILGLGNPGDSDLFNGSLLALKAL